MTVRSRLASVLLLSGLAGSAAAVTPTPVATPTAPAPSPSLAPGSAASPTTVPTATPITTPSPARPSPSPTRAVAATDEPVLAPAVPSAPDGPPMVAPAATAVRAAPRTYRTPERAAPRPFMAPQADVPATDDGLAEGAAPSVPPMGGSRPPARANGGLVVFRVTARTALEGFDLRVGYPRAVGAFGTSARPAECNAGTGTLVAANDRGDGELRLLVASAQALPFPLDVFCRFTSEPGAGIGAGDLTVRVAEVTSGGKRADPSLLLVSVVVR